MITPVIVWLGIDERDLTKILCKKFANPSVREKDGRVTIQ